ncbi:hypothetical protein [Aquirhabdus sp.]|uniref:hypothetical protein n=1 Tax=Aquirhabdus sp. TaxID=2824160 RepID=UPI00396CFEED
MAILEQTRPYETLIRHHADGTVTAHHQQIYVLTKDGIVIAENIFDPVALSSVDLSQTLGAATVAALGENAQLKTTLTNLQNQLDAAQALATSLQEQVNRLSVPVVANADVAVESA